MAIGTELARLNGLGPQDDVGGYKVLADRIAAVRDLIQIMTRLSGVPIEPPEQTALLDAVTGVDGVIGGVVPGAGGYDAVALIMRDDEETRDRLKNRLAEWNRSQRREKGGDGEGGGEGEMQPPKAGVVSMLTVREDCTGVRGEDAGGYSGWNLVREESREEQSTPSEAS